MTEVKASRIHTIIARLEKQYGTASRVAESLNISEAYLSDVKKGTREPGPKFLAGLAALGFKIKRVVSYVEDLG